MVELWPGSGWYTEILAPFLAQKGQLIVTNEAPNQNKLALAFQQKLAADPEVFGKVKVVEINPPTELTLAPDNSVDMVVTFRNIHNWVDLGRRRRSRKPTPIAPIPISVASVLGSGTDCGT